jgi:chromatin remodeling complex protein RSC6
MAKKAKKAAKKTASKSAARSTGRGAAKKSAKSAKSTRGSSRGASKGGARKSTGRKPNAAFMAPVQPSDTLAEVVGAKPIPRTEVTKRLWAYIKKNRLQDPKNRRMINSDATLKPVFGGKSSVNMFEMTKLVNKHLR